MSIRGCLSKKHLDELERYGYEVTKLSDAYNFHRIIDTCMTVTPFASMDIFIELKDYHISWKIRPGPSVSVTNNCDQHDTQ
jgi:hypothetical protein